ncbi:AMP-binding protein [Actinocrispum wychmicini]|uniref:Acyl-CoA synthetase (AMP-forming)/AMP-acid ligase II n=1 Tax=Actinocrispum wychmicini TaxID=1213861 RepID=A0A4R2IN90_9PSEU|nr:AMP-binding protein [Actinocrispum wychmicini]TCO46543.1 acyl-CoA synthetase (AMP-forming)/AMP-acid ligase II [Actinocrispum wychmicini]
MRSECFEVRTVVSHPPSTVWEVIGEPELYPRYVRGLAWCERVTTHRGRGSRYLLRVDRDDEVEVLIYRRDEHIVWSSVAARQHRLSIRLRPTSRGGTEINVLLTLLAPDRELPLGETAIRRRVEEAFDRLSDQLDRVPAPLPPTPRDPASSRGSLVSVAKVLVKAGVLTAARPDKTVRQLAALGRWGATVVGGYGASAARAPHDLAYQDERSQRTFAEVEERTNRLAHALKSYQVGPGSRVALMCRNHGAMIESMIACGKLGADVVLMNTGLAANQIAEVIRLHTPAVLMADDEFGRLGQFVPAHVPRIRTWPETEHCDVRTVEDLIAEGSPDRLAPPGRAGRIVVLTSGTTGSPKGARRPTPRGLGDAAAVLSRIPLRVGEKMLVSAPLFHTWGLAAMQLGTALRATLVLQRRFDPQSALRAIVDHKCTSMFAVPIMLQRMMDLPDSLRERYDTSSLRVVASSGSALPGRLVDHFMDSFGDVLYNLYGSTEVSWATIADPADLRAARTTAGHPPFGTRIGILDSQGISVPPGSTGRIFVGNDMLFEGYTDGGQLALRHTLMDTGDRGYLDADGRLFVDGRDDEMIVSGGENVFPRPVEDILAALPQVREAAVVGVPDIEYGQRLAAYIVLRPGSRLDADSVRTYVHQRLARFAVPRDVVFVETLPRNATGKVLKRVLEDGHW